MSNARHICAGCKRGFMHLQELCNHACVPEPESNEQQTFEERLDPTERLTMLGTLYYEARLRGDRGEGYTLVAKYGGRPIEVEVFGSLGATSRVVDAVIAAREPPTCLAIYCVADKRVRFVQDMTGARPGRTKEG